MALQVAKREDIKNMQTWVIVMLVIFGVAILVGIGVGVYFLTRPKKKAGSGSGKSGGSGNGGLLPTKPSGGLPTAFSISPRTKPNRYLTLQEGTVNPWGSTPLTVITTDGSQNLCVDYKWANTSNPNNSSLLVVYQDPKIIHDTGYNEPLNISNSSLNSIAGPAILSNNGYQQYGWTGGISLINWKYTSDKKWCCVDPGYSQYCLYHNPDNTVSIQDSAGSTDLGFVWDVIPLINSPICSP